MKAIHCQFWLNVSHDCLALTCSFSFVTGLVVLRVSLRIVEVSDVHFHQVSNSNIRTDKRGRSTVKWVVSLIAQSLAMVGHV